MRFVYLLDNAFFTGMCFQKEFKYRRDFREDDVFSVRMRKNAALENAFHVKRIEDFDGKGTAGFEVIFLIGVIIIFLYLAASFFFFYRSVSMSLMLLTS